MVVVSSKGSLKGVLGRNWYVLALTDSLGRKTKPLGRIEVSIRSEPTWVQLDQFFGWLAPGPN